MTTLENSWKISTDVTKTCFTSAYFFWYHRILAHASARVAGDAPEKGVVTLTGCIRTCLTQEFRTNEIKCLGTP